VSSASPSLTLAAPAKINLFLHVTGRRADGYHDLQSVFVPVSLADHVEVTVTDTPDIELVDPPPGLDSDCELTCRAARLLARQTGVKPGARIRLSKRIPTGAGLGGGSSDAASGLIALNRLWRCGLARTELAALGVQLGADIPFFLGDGPALVEGIGERLTPVTVPPAHVVIAHPGVPAPTGRVFTDIRVCRDTPTLRAEAWPLGFGRNDLQRAACAVVPEIDALTAALTRSLADAGLHANSPIRLTGSGSAVYVMVADAASAQRAARALEGAGWRAWAARTLNHLPARNETAPGELL